MSQQPEKAVVSQLTFQQATSESHLSSTLFVRERLDVRRSALVVVDMQRYWTDSASPRGAYLQEEYPAQAKKYYEFVHGTVIPALVATIAVYREGGLPVIYVTTGSTRSDRSDLVPHLARRALSRDRAAAGFGCLEVGTRWYEIEPALGIEGKEVVLNKTSRGAFTTTKINSILRNLQVDQIVVGGISSDACVFLTAVEATELGFEVFLLSDGCATFYEENHQSALSSFRRLWGGVVAAHEIKLV
jgi:nicotinamidase-related amidase